MDLPRFETQINVDEWWTGLTPSEQKNPVNKAKYETANRVLDDSRQSF